MKSDLCYLTHFTGTFILSCKQVLDFILVIYVTQAIEQGRQISDEVC